MVNAQETCLQDSQQGLEGMVNFPISMSETGLQGFLLILKKNILLYTWKNSLKMV